MRGKRRRLEEQPGSEMIEVSSDRYRIQILRNFMSKTSLFLSALFLLASRLFAANPAGVGPDAARESVRRFIVGDGLEATLFASEPMVRNPTDMDIDARGRVWITEGV